MAMAMTLTLTLTLTKPTPTPLSLHHNHQNPKRPHLSSTHLLKTTLTPFPHLGHAHLPLHLTKTSLNTSHNTKNPIFNTPTCTCDTFNDTANADHNDDGDKAQPVKTVLWVLFWASLSLAVFAFSKDSKAAGVVVSVGGGGGGGVDSSIRASSFGLKIAERLRGFGWADQAVVFALATLPVIELRGAIPVGYWLQLKPFALTAFAILGNMVPVPFIILYLKKLATFLAAKNRTASRVLDMLFERAKEKAGPVEEFQWLGLMLFVAVPFPGTGAWTGAIIASVLDMPFWPAVSANFFGVVLAGLLVNLLVNLGLKHAIITGVLLFLISTFMWSALRSLRKSLSSTN